LVFLANLDAFFGLDRLVQALRPAASRHGSAGELVDDHHFAAAHDVFDIPLVERVGAQRRVQVMHQTDVRGVVEAFALAQQAGIDHQRFDLLVADLGQMHLPLLFVDDVVARRLGLVGTGEQVAHARRRPLGALQARHEFVHRQIGVGGFFGRPRNDERRARFVDEDRIHLVDDGETQAALHAILEPEREVVTQIVEAEFVVGAVGDIAGVGGTLFRRGLRVADHAHGQPEKAIHRTHPVGVALREVLVDRDHVHAFTRQRIEVGGQRRDQGLALAGAHLGDPPAMQGDAAEQLHVEVAHAERTAGRFADHRKGLGKQVIERTAGRKAAAKFVSFGAQRRVVERLQRRFESRRGAHLASHGFEHALVATAENALEKIEHYGQPCQDVGIKRGILRCARG